MNKRDHAGQIDNVKTLVKNEVGNFLDYIEKQNTNFYSYRDYEHAYAMLQNDEKFKQAIKFATITRVVNATELQKKLKIGCSRAEKYVETMQNLGIIGRDEFYILRTES